jgi:hypothetical protein
MKGESALLTKLLPNRYSRQRISRFLNYIVLRRPSISFYPGVLGMSVWAGAVPR